MDGGEEGACGGHPGGKQGVQKHRVRSTRSLSGGRARECSEHVRFISGDSKRHLASDISGLL